MTLNHMTAAASHTHTHTADCELMSSTADRLSSATNHQKQTLNNHHIPDVCVLARPKHTTNDHKAIVNA